jgi:hypothetical protein
MAADEAVLNIVEKKIKNPPKNIFFKYVSSNLIWQPSTTWKVLF